MRDPRSQEPQVRAAQDAGTGSDPVNHPSHYTHGGIETRDYIAAKRLNFNRGNVVKYVSRAGHKEGADELEDLEKAMACLQHEIALVKAGR